MSSGVRIQIPALQQLLGQCQRRMRLHTLARGSAETVSVAAVCLSVSCLLDFLLILPGPLRLLLLITSAALTLLVLIRRLIQPLLASVPAEELGAAVDLRFPELHEALATLISLERMEAGHEAIGSVLMQQKLQRQVQSQLRIIRPSQVVQVQPVIQRAGVAGLLLLLGLVPLFGWPDGSQLLIRRLLLPFANLASPTNLFFEVPAADRIVASGTDVSFLAIPRWRTGRPGTLPQDVFVELRSALQPESEIPDAKQAPESPAALFQRLHDSELGPIEQLPMSWNEQSGQFLAELQDAGQSLLYRIRGGGAVTEWYSLVVADSPRILTATLTETPPAYTGRPVQTVDGALGEMFVFEQSDLELQLKFSKPVATVQMVWKDYQPIRRLPAASGEEMVPGENGTLLPEEIAAAASGVAMEGSARTDEQQPPQAEIVLSEDRTAAAIRLQAMGSGAFQLLATDDLQLQNAEVTQRRLTVTLDTPPKLSVTGLADGLDVRPDDIVPLNCSVTDDVGVGGLEVHFQKNEEAVRVQPALPLERGATNIAHEFRIDLKALALKTGDVVEFRVRADDERPVPGPNRVWAGPWVLRISDNAEPLGQKALREADQQLVDALRKMAEQIGQDSVRAIQLREAAQRDWKPEARDDVRALSEQEQTRGNELQQLAEQAGQHPLMQKPAARLAALSQQLRERVPEKLDQAAIAEKDPAAQKLQDSANELNQIRDEVNRATDDIQKAAALEQELAELNRLALDAEKLAEDADSLRQQRAQGQPEAGQSQEDFQQQLRQEQSRLQADQQELSQDLDSLLQRRAELLQAAREAQWNQAADMARELQNLAQQQQQLAEGIGEEARDAARDSEALANELQQAQQQLQQLAQQVEQHASDVKKPETQPLDEAVRDLRQGNLAKPQAAITSSQQALQSTVEQLAQPVAPKPQDPARPADDSSKAAEQRALDEQNSRRQQLGQQGQDALQKLASISERLQQLAQNRGTQRQPSGAPDDMDTPPGDAAKAPGAAEPSTTAPTEPAPDTKPPGTEGNQPAGPSAEVAQAQRAAGNLLEQLQQLNDAAREQRQQLKENPQLANGAGNNADQAATRAEEAQRHAKAGQFQKAAERLRNAASESSLAADQLTTPETQDRQLQLQRQRDDFNRLADSLRQLQDNSAAQLSAQQQAQEQVAEQARQIPDRLRELADRLQSPALGLQNQAQPSREAAEATGKGAESGEQTSGNLQQTQFQQATQTAQEAAGQLNRAAQLAQQASQGARDPGNLVPTDVGESVGEALQSLREAAELMNEETAQPSPGAQGENGDAGEPSANAEPSDNAMPGTGAEQNTAGQQPQGQMPSDGSSTPNGNQEASSSEAAGESKSGQSQGAKKPGSGTSQEQGSAGSPGQLAKAARSLKNAAKGALPSQFSPGQLSSDSSQASSDSKSAGNPAGFDGVDPAATLKKGQRRQWGQLQDQLDNDVQDGGREVLDQEYSEMIRRYRRDLARTRQQNDNGKTNQQP
ncbi:MAG: hypothetical protein RLZZ232_2919 [Planctomycetota bacterium]